MEESMKVDKNFIVMASEPAPELTLERAREMYAAVFTEQDLADVFAVIENKAWWMEGEEYEYDEGSEEHKSACAITNKWFEIADRIRNDIFVILHSEGVEIPQSGQIAILEPFMKRNGYRNGNGWWIKESVVSYYTFPDAPKQRNTGCVGS